MRCKQRALGPGQLAEYHCHAVTVDQSGLKFPSATPLGVARGVRSIRAISTPRPWPVDRGDGGDIEGVEDEPFPLA